LVLKLGGDGEHPCLDALLARSGCIEQFVINATWYPKEGGFILKSMCEAQDNENESSQFERVYD